MKRVFALALGLLPIAGSAPAQNLETPEYSPKDGKFYVVDKEARFRLPGVSGAIAHVVYRPNSVLEDSETKLAPGVDGWFTWKPKFPGLARLRVTDSADKTLAEKVVSVRFRSTSYLGLAVMLFAALALFGGAFVSIRALLRDQPRSEA